jgi:hypothetical protein
VGQPERGRIEMFTGGQSAAVAAEGGCVGDRTRVSAAVTRRATVRVAKSNGAAGQGRTIGRRR